MLQISCRLFRYPETVVQEIYNLHSYHRKPAHRYMSSVGPVPVLIVINSDRLSYSSESSSSLSKSAFMLRLIFLSASLKSTTFASIS